MSSSSNRLSDVMVKQTLRKTPMFADIAPASLDRFVEDCELQSVPRGNYLFHEGEPAHGFYIVHAGAINVHRVTEDGKEQVIRVFYPGECFGEVVLVGDQSYPASAKTTENSQVILVRTEYFRQQIHRDPDIALSILASMSLHLKYLVETVEALKLRQAESRIAQWLLKQVDEQGLATDTQPTITLPLAKHLLASQLGITSETLSRVFARLKSEALIEVDGKSVQMLDLKGIRDYLMKA